MANITSAVRYVPNDGLLKFKRSLDRDGRVADLTDNMAAYEVFYQVTIVTQPGGAMFEATIRYKEKDNTFLVNDREISRINKYGSQPHCVAEMFPHLRPYCYCFEQQE